MRQFNGELFAAVSNGLNSVAVFRRSRTGLTFQKLVMMMSAPATIYFANDQHGDVAGATTVDCFGIDHGRVESLDGTAGAVGLANGATPPSGSTSQVGVINDRQLIVTLKNDPDPGAVDVVFFSHGRIAGVVPTAVPAPAGTLAPFGFAVYPDGTALIMLAHSTINGIFRDGAFVALLDLGQTANCSGDPGRVVCVHREHGQPHAWPRCRTG